MRIIGIVEDNKHTVVGYVLFNRNANQSSAMFRVFEKEQVKFLIQGHGNIENAVIEDGEVVLTENAITRLPHYNSVTHQTSDTTNKLYVMVCEKITKEGVNDANAQYHIIAMGNNLSQIQLQTVEEGKLLTSIADNVNYNLVNAKVVEKNGKLILQGIKKPITVQTIKDAPQIKKEEIASETAKKTKTTEMRRIRCQKAKNKIITGMANRFTSFAVVHGGLQFMGISAPSYWPARTYQTFAKVFIEVITSYCTKEEIDICKKSLKFLQENKLTKTVAFSNCGDNLIKRFDSRGERLAVLTEKDAHYKKFCQCCFILFSAICKHPDFKIQVERNIAKLKIPSARANTKFIEKDSIADMGMNSKYASIRFKQFLNRYVIISSATKIKQDAKERAERRIFATEYCYNFDTTLVTAREIIEVHDHIKYRIRPVFYKFADGILFEKACNEQNKADLLFVKNAYLRLQKLRYFKPYGIGEDYYSLDVIEDMKTKLRSDLEFCLVYLATYNKTLYDMFMELYVPDLNIIDITPNDIKKLIDTKKYDLPKQAKVEKKVLKDNTIYLFIDTEVHFWKYKLLF